MPPELPAEKPVTKPKPEPAIAKPVKEIEKPKQEKQPTAKPLAETPAAPAKGELKKPVTLKPAKPVIATPDAKPAAPVAEPIKDKGNPAARQPAEVNPKKPTENGDEKRDSDRASDLLKKKLTPEEKAALKDEAEKALKSLREKLEQ